MDNCLFQTDLSRATGIVEGDNAIRVEQDCQVGIVEWNFFQGIAGSAVYFHLPQDGLWFGSVDDGTQQLRSTYQWTIVWNVMEDVGAQHNRAPIFVNGSQCSHACLDQLHIVHNVIYNSEPLDNHIHIDLARNVGGDIAIVDNIFYMATARFNAAAFVRNTHYLVYNATEHGSAPEFFYGVGTATLPLTNCSSGCLLDADSTANDGWAGYQIQLQGNVYASPFGRNVTYFVDEELNAINATRWPAARSIAALRASYGYEVWPAGQNAGKEFALDPVIEERLALLGRPLATADPATGAVLSLSSPIVEQGASLTVPPSFRCRQHHRRRHAAHRVRRLHQRHRPVCQRVGPLARRHLPLPRSRAIPLRL